MKELVIKFFSFLCVFVVLISVFGINIYAQDDTTSVATLEVKSEKLTLSLDKVSGQLTLKNTVNGDVWYSTPKNATEDPLASGITRTNLLSRILVCYKNGNSLSYTNDYIGSVLKNNVKYSLKNNSIYAEYSFADLDFVIPVEFSVKDNVFTAKILAKKITEGSKYLINSIDLLPFFGAGGTSDEGYILVPDGSGAVINFNNGKFGCDSYSKQVFGEDISMANEVKELNYKKISIASFGISNNGSAFIANISDGAGCAKINASVSGQSCSYNRAYSSFCYRNIQYIKASDNSGNKNSGLFTALKTAASDEFSVNYTMLDNSESGISEMAQATQERLKKSGVSSELKSRLVLEFYGGVQKEKAFLGIRYTGIERFTSYGDVLEILKNCADMNIYNIDSELKYFSIDNISGKISKGFKYSHKLGKKSDYKALINNQSVYPYINISSFSKGKSYFSSAFGLDLVPVKLYDYSIQNRKIDNTKKPKYLLAYSKYESVLNDFIKNADRQGLNAIATDNLSGTLYSDFSRKGVLRDGTIEIINNSLKALDDNGIKKMMSAPNEYAFKYADIISDLPVSSSGYGLFDYDVPFCQMCLHGLIDYTSEAVNLGAISRQQFLQIIKTGSQLKFSVIKNGGKSIEGTKLEYLSSADFDSIKHIIGEWYAAVNVVTEKVVNAKMIYYSEHDGVSLTKYDNNVNIYVNSNLEDCEIDGITIPSMDYIIVN